MFIILGCNSKSNNQTDKADARNCDEWSDISESEIINVDDLSSISESENDDIISDDWSDISDVAVETETLKKGKKNSNLVDRRFEHVLVKSIHIIFHEHTQENKANALTLS